MVSRGRRSRGARQLRRARPGLRAGSRCCRGCRRGWRVSWGLRGEVRSTNDEVRTGLTQDGALIRTSYFSLRTSRLSSREDAAAELSEQDIIGGVVLRVALEAGALEVLHLVWLAVLQGL